MCGKIAEFFQDEDGCYINYVMDIIPFCNGQLADGVFTIVQLVILSISILLFCVSILTGTNTYEIWKRVAIFGTMVAFATVCVAAIKVTVAFCVEQNKAKAEWELGMFIGVVLLTFCCCVISWDYPCVPTTLCLPIFLIIAEIIKNLVTDDSSCFHPNQYN